MKTFRAAGRSDHEPTAEALLGLLEGYPGVALELDGSGAIRGSNGCLEELLGRGVLGSALESLLVREDAALWERLGPSASGACPLRFRGATEEVTLRLHAVHTRRGAVLLEAPAGRAAAMAWADAAGGSDAGHLRAVLAERTRELGEALAMRDRFFAAMSHELRTPLNAVMGYSHLLLEGVAGSLTTEQREYLDRALTAARHLRVLIDDVLDLAKLRSGHYALSAEYVHIPVLLDQVLATMQPMAAEQHMSIALAVSGPPTLHTDPRALQQILLNLLSNAVKYAPGADVTLRYRGEGSVVVFEVADQGPGIAADARERVFDEYVQVRATPGTHGTGLGLPIARQLARRLGGELSVQPGAQRGCTFTLRLPRRT